MKTRIPTIVLAIIMMAMAVPASTLANHPDLPPRPSETWCNNYWDDSDAQVSATPVESLQIDANGQPDWSFVTRYECLMTASLEEVCTDSDLQRGIQGYYEGDFGTFEDLDSPSEWRKTDAADEFFALRKEYQRLLNEAFSVEGRIPPAGVDPVAPTFEEILRHAGDEWNGCYVGRYGAPGALG